MRKRRNKRQTAVRIIAIILAALMVLGIMGALLDIFFYL